MTSAVLHACAAAAGHIKLAVAAIGLIAVTTAATVAIVVVGSHQVTPPAPAYRAEQQLADGPPGTLRVVVPPTSGAQPSAQPAPPAENSPPAENPAQPAENSGSGVEAGSTTPGSTTPGSSTSGSTTSGSTASPASPTGPTPPSRDDTIVPGSGRNTPSTGNSGGGVIPVGNPSTPAPPPVINKPSSPANNAPHNPPVVVPKPKPPVPAVTTPVCVHGNDTYDVYRITVGKDFRWITVHHTHGKIAKGCPVSKDSVQHTAKNKKHSHGKNCTLHIGKTLVKVTGSKCGTHHTPPPPPKHSQKCTHSKHHH